jgi:hypothetical protein
VICRLGWHRWTPWRRGARFIDTSYGVEMPSREYLSHCRRCDKPRRMCQFQITTEGK